ASWDRLKRNARVGSPLRARRERLAAGCSGCCNRVTETAMDRAQKADSIEALKGVFDGAGAVVVTHYLGLTVAEMTDLRGRLAKDGAKLKVVKNRLAQKAMNGSADGAKHALFKGPVAIAYGPDVSSAAKVAIQYAKDNDKFVVVGGFMGDTVLD